jgi:alkylation response protein AidB-like acyl-CoA dehydrogenase
MVASQTTPTGDRVRSDWAALARELGPRFAARAAAHDAADSFVAENYRELRERRLFSAGVPAELGGGGALPRRLFRDVQSARYHPARRQAQLLYSGRLALGLDVNG